jgi:hypothetical protein
VCVESPDRDSTAFIGHHGAIAYTGRGLSRRITEKAKGEKNGGRQRVMHLTGSRLYQVNWRDKVGLLFLLVEKNNLSAPNPIANLLATHR